MSTKVGLGESNREGRVGWKIKLRVAFSPVSALVNWESLGGSGQLSLDDCNVYWSRGACAIDLLVSHGVVEWFCIRFQIL